MLFRSAIICIILKCNLSILYTYFLLYFSLLCFSLLYFSFLYSTRLFSPLLSSVELLYPAFFFSHFCIPYGDWYWYKRLSPCPSDQKCSLLSHISHQFLILLFYRQEESKKFYDAALVILRLFCDTRLSLRNGIVLSGLAQTITCQQDIEQALLSARLSSESLSSFLLLLPEDHAVVGEANACLADFLEIAGLWVIKFYFIPLYSI